MVTFDHLPDSLLESKHIYIHAFKQRRQGCMRKICMVMLIVDRSICQVGMYLKARIHNTSNCMVLALRELFKLFLDNEW